MELNTHLSLDLAVLLLNIKHICKQKSQANKKKPVRIFAEALRWGRVINWGIFAQWNVSTSDTHNNIMHEPQRHPGAATEEHKHCTFSFL